ncbi:hypothetical protein JYU34_009179, partial [Plutella xylostella]
TIYLGSADNYRANFGDMLLDFVNIFYLDASWRECGLWAGRGAALAAGVLGLLLMQFYSASLLGAVLAPPPRLIASLQDLLRSDLAYKVEDVAYQRQFFKEHMDIPEIAALYNTKILKGPLPPFVDNAVGVKHLMEGNFAFQCTGTYLWHEAARWDDALLCSLDELRVFPRMQQYVSVARGSPYKQHVLTALRAIQERGVRARMLPRYYSRRPRCPPEHADAPRPVALPQALPALRMLAALGTAAARCCLVLILVEI